MRILVVGQSFWPNLGGAEVMLRRLASEWVLQGHQVHVLTTDLRWESTAAIAAPDREPLDGFAVERLRFRKIRLLGTALYMAQLRRWLFLHRESFDVAYVSMLKHAGHAVVGACQRIQRPCVLRAEGAGATGDVAWLRHAWFGGAIARRCRQAAAIVAPSRTVERELLEFGFPSGLVHRFENAVPLSIAAWNPRDRAAARRKLGLVDLPTVVYAGRLHGDKCLGDLLAGILAIRDSGQEIQCLLVGGGPEEQRLRQAARELQISDAVRFVGQVADVQPYLATADAFVLPSRHEGLSVALLEALAAGVPSIASDIDANRELLDQGLLPLFALNRPDELAKALGACLQRRDDVEFRRSIQAAVAERFGLPRLAARHAELFARLMNA